MFDIQVDQSAGVIHVTLGGMMTVAEVDEYIAALRRAFVTNRLQSYAMILDVSQCPIQSQDMIAAMGRHMADMPKSRAIAVVVGGSLAKMQVRRLFTQSYMRIVPTLADARAWVVAGTEPVPDRPIATPAVT